MTWIKDLKLLRCSWVYDLNLPISRKILSGEGCIDRIFGSLPESPEFIELKEQLTGGLMVCGVASARPAKDCMPE